MHTSVRCLSAFFLVGVPVVGLSSCAGPDLATAGRTAEDFINTHVSADPGYEEALARVAESPVVTERYRKSLPKLYREALAKDPVYGYGADAVTGGQDVPDRFRVKISETAGDRARVVLIGEDPRFPIELRADLVREDGRWLVDASGDLVAE